MYKGLAVIFGFFFLGELLSTLLALPIPGSVTGMILLTLALLSGAVKLEDVEREADFLIRNMSVMFIPPGVGVVVYWGLIASNLLPVAATLVFSFLATLLAAALAANIAGGEEP